MNFTFEGKTYFQTYLGGCASIFAFVLMLTFLGVSTGKLVGHLDPFFSSSIEVMDPSEEINLWEMGFMFAVEKIDPSVGTIMAFRAVNDPEGNEIRDPVQFSDCDELAVNRGSSYDGLRDVKASSYLCPIIDQDSLVLQGHYKYENFKYFKIAVNACQQNDESNENGQQCADKNTIAKTKINLVILKQFPSIFTFDYSRAIESILDFSHFYYLDPSYT